MTVIGSDLNEAARLLTAGQLVAIPTETVYGLAANALNPEAVLRIFEVKERPSFDPLIVHVNSIAALQEYASSVPHQAMALAQEFWPGPLTLVLPKKEIIPDLVTSGLPGVGLRMPAHPLALSLLRQLPFPLAAPSANPFGYISPTLPQHVYRQLQGKIPYILDGGPCTIGVESTIVGFEGDEVLVYRLGGLPFEHIQRIVPGAQLRLNASSNPAAPGMLLSHYAPRKPLLLGEIEKLLEMHPGRRTAVLSFRRDFSDIPGVSACEVLSPSGDLHEAAAHLFAAMRRLDEADLDLILAEPVPDTGIGRAVNDRLRRASAE